MIRTEGPIFGRDKFVGAIPQSNASGAFPFARSIIVRYTITYLIDGQPTTAQVEARDAAAAVATIKRAQNSDALFELLCVMLIDKPAPDTRAQSAA